MADAEDKGLAEDREQSKDWKLFGPYLRERQWGERYHQFYGNDFRVECPTGSGRWLTLRDAAIEIASRLTRTFLPDSEGHRPCHGSDPRFSEDLHWRDLVLFYEYFHGDTGRGCGASHRGWTAFVAPLLERLGAHRQMGPARQSSDSFSEMMCS
jgi:hypothetical protein